MKRLITAKIGAVVLFTHLATTPALAFLPLANGCDDPDYSWWEYSGIQALTCLLSGQWTDDRQEP